MVITMTEIAMAISLLTANQATYEPEELICLTRAVYHEARGEPEWGQYAVAEVVINRTKSMKYSDTICDVVSEDHQFPWHNAENPNIHNYSEYTQSMTVAFQSLEGIVDADLQGATHFYAHNKVQPYWAKKLELIDVIGSHTFMKEHR